MKSRQNSFLIRVQNATVFLKDQKVLNAINWTVGDRENWAVVGNNGSGKTTLLRLIFGELLPVEGGTVHWFNSEAWHGLLEIRQQVGFVSAEYQANYDQNVTGLEVVESGFFSSIGLWQKVPERQKQSAEEQMQFLGIEHLARRRYRDLSYGEARRVLLARALVNRPRLLILDEPCSGLDIPTRELFLDTLQKLARRTRLIYVTHHIEEILPAITHVLYLKNGQVVGQGNKERLLKDEALSRVLDCKVTIQPANGRYWLSGVSRPKRGGGLGSGS